jgi:hypothetical protein
MLSKGAWTSADDMISGNGYGFFDIKKGNNPVSFDSFAWSMVS